MTPPHLPAESDCTARSLSSKRWGVRRHGVAPALIVALAGCTLTADDFTPADVTVQQATSSEPEPVASPSVTEASPTIAEACAGAEDISACLVTACLEAGCAEACANGVLDGDETDVDCGGSCAPCTLERACRAASDCIDGSCTAAVCAAPSCQDGEQNGSEVAVDCGGDCPPCAAGQLCSSDADCESPLFCAAGAGVCTAPTCEDGVRNGAEADIDCGGGACPACADGAACVEATDCASGSCGQAGRCAAPGCDDGVLNGDERGTDCGAVCAVGCEPGTPCEEAADCSSGVCDAPGCDAAGDCCQAPSCEDGVRNGTEPVVDCGDETCGLCATGAACSDDEQCATGSCGASDTCELLPTCDDGLRNGNEGDVDCGGSDATCPRCDTGDRCRVDADCDDDSCVEGECASCDDGILNGDEERADCGGEASGCPACPRCIEENSTDLLGPGTVSTVPANSCVKISAFANGVPPTFIDSPSGPFPLSFSWRQDCTGSAAVNVFNFPFEQRLFVGLSTGCAVIIDLGGSAAPAQLRWF